MERERVGARKKLAEGEVKATIQEGEKQATPCNKESWQVL